MTINKTSRDTARASAGTTVSCGSCGDVLRGVSGKSKTTQSEIETAVAAATDGISEAVREGRIGLCQAAKQLLLLEDWRERRLSGKKETMTTESEQRG